MPHHRSDGGVRKALIDPIKKHVISLGRENNLVCTLIEKYSGNEKFLEELRSELQSEKMSKMFQRHTAGFLLKGESPEMTWFEVMEIRRREEERVACEKDRERILIEFDSIRKEIQELLTKNLEGPENEKLDIQKFNLDKERAEEMKKHNEALCEHTKNYLQALIVAQDEVTDFCRKYFWDGKEVQAQKLRAISENLDVDNYVILPATSEATDALQKAEEWRKLELLLADEDCFRPWLPQSKE